VSAHGILQYSVTVISQNAIFQWLCMAFCDIAKRDILQCCVFFNLMAMAMAMALAMALASGHYHR